MTPFLSIKTCFMKSFDFKGYASKSEYWWFWLFQVIMVSLFIIIEHFEDTVVGTIVLGILIASIPANISSMVRRFHDAGFSTRSWLKRFLATVSFIIIGWKFSGLFGYTGMSMMAMITIGACGIEFLSLFIVLIGDSVYEEDEE